MTDVPDAAVEAFFVQKYGSNWRTGLSKTEYRSFFEEDRAAIAAALPHLVAERDAEIAELEKTVADYGDIIATMTRFSEGKAKEIAQLRAAVEPISRMKCFPDAQVNMMTLATAIRIARAALEPPGDG